MGPTWALIRVVILIMALSVHATAAEPRITVTVTVRDEAGQSVSGAYVGVAFFKPQGSETLSDRTDAKGTAQLTGRTYIALSILVRKDGYYESRIADLKPYEVKDGQRVFTDQVLTIGLRPIKNPIPMYARFQYETRIPVAKKPVGFDLMEGDWVVPYGKGRTADFLFTVSGFWKGVYEYDYSLTLSFPNDGDGLLPFEGHPTSDFISPYEALEAGYHPQKTWRQSSTPKAGPRPGPGSPAVTTVDEVSPRANYVFRVRTVRDREGKIISALYGKLYGDPRSGAPVEKGAYLDLTYYLNPTPNDRNLESDPQRNLAAGLKSFEYPRQP